MMAEPILRYLEAEGFGTLSQTLFLGFQPEQPDNCITASDEAVPPLFESNGLSVDDFGVQITARNVNQFQARDTLMDIHFNLAAFGGRFTPDSPDVTVVKVYASPGYIGRDDRGRHEWTVHYSVRTTTENNAHRL